MFWKLQENVISDEDIELLVSFIRETKRFTQFSKVKEFEQAFAEWLGCKHCVFVNSGSSANLILVNAAKELHGWEDKDEIIVPAVTWPTTITPVMQLGLKPVFVDTNLSDLSFNYDQLASRITERTRGIFVAHLLGFPADFQRLMEIVGDRDIQIIEDSCESQGALYRGTAIKVGNLGRGSTFSFYWGHHMTTVEGGMLCTNDDELYKLFLLKRSHGLARELPEEYHDQIMAQYPDIDFKFLFLTDGFNFRNTEFNAVLGLAQLKHIDEFIKIRNRNYRQFLELCKRYPRELITLEVEGFSSFVLPFIFYDLHKKKLFQNLIGTAGIESRPLISGNLLRQPFLIQYYDPDGYKKADFLHTNAFYIGNNQFVNDERLNILEGLMEEFFNY
ncbi:MAG: DegT/DnrJ/EryC1/StrS aminotransferase family protein [Bacteroidetes bacterium]|nr:DegT/DnrJ/EryC1/StrS aminotransferase family protein [Bacteroidota bacterium]